MTDIGEIYLILRGRKKIMGKRLQNLKADDVIAGQPLVCCIIIYLPGTSDGGAVTNYQTPHIQSVRKF